MHPLAQVEVAGKGEINLLRMCAGHVGACVVVDWAVAGGRVVMDVLVLHLDATGDGALASCSSDVTTAQTIGRRKPRHPNNHNNNNTVTISPVFFGEDTIRGDQLQSALLPTRVQRFVSSISLQ